MLQNTLNLHLGCQQSEAKVLKMFFTPMDERKKRDLMFPQCTIKLMALSVRVNKNIETMFGQFLKHSIDLDMLKRKYHKELPCRYIQNVLEECFQKQLLLKRQLKISNLSL